MMVPWLGGGGFAGPDTWQSQFSLLVTVLGIFSDLRIFIVTSLVIPLVATVSYTTINCTHGGKLDN
ncbi:hypothetical protein BDW59DRAFT_140001 [Aspergillus cavernicola]|uniref:Uncharacterized protein n=1 Tax=Aspergillus cavernicola TaxID=176166 RepID=A0ABR4IVI0_9EURO